MIDVVKVKDLGKAYKNYNNRWARVADLILPTKKINYKQSWVIKNINFSITQGEAIGIVGANGSGKSTLLKLITGTIQPTTGKIQIIGRVAALLELGIGFHPDFTGRQNVIMAGQLLGLLTNHIKNLLPEIEKFADISEYIDKPIRVYSSGMQVRLAFAVATALRPDILIVDEALSVGDAYFQHKCFQKIRQFQEQGTTLIFVSHDLSAVQAICKKTIWIDKGEIIKIGETKEVLESYTKAIYANLQDVNSKTRIFEKNKKIKTLDNSEKRRDCRADFINNSNIRNDIKVFEFNKNSLPWGDGQAQLITSYLQDENGNQLSWIIGGEEVTLSIEARAKRELKNVICGFMVKDKFGQNLFGDNNYLTSIQSPVNINSETNIKAEFNFNMPKLPNGIYSVTVAIASGTQESHIIHEWYNEAFYFESKNGNSVTGLIGIPMFKINVSQIN